LGKLSKFGSSAQEIISKVEGAIKSAVLKQSNLFESLNLRYFGPVDGHDVDHLVEILRDLKDIPGPKILHCITVKGKGYGPAESGNKTTWHAPGTFDKLTGEIYKKTPSTPQPPKYQDVFGHTMIELAEKDARIMGVTPAMPSGSSMNLMMAAMPDRAFDVGIAEQHAVTFSAGMATQGLVPFCNIYCNAPTTRWCMTCAFKICLWYFAWIVRALPVQMVLPTTGLTILLISVASPTWWFLRR
jgi:1-deoxy-D-xylulose-5-phosphate synthase